ncbi:hypothetical protein KUL25_19770 [Rhodobacteraceae bacterium N5(2021)]|uniref:Uncharacterized protein n=1 Tax=Gymnodinialimonas phycosphaerae TaxID=2841589 RepID=A0A975TUI7_9RHOB|nr:hypothetical protein [Gymnodinialimonas phycosphaerae]MBY4895003.1 hypothetical protein [Gymnodinialimonas phycosphaerae]
MGFVVHPDGIVAPIGKPSSRLRFGFPLKGVLAGFAIAVAVKAYLIWFLGADIYALEVQALLNGAPFEQIAAMVLMPDALSAWLVERYDAINIFIQAGLAAGEPA